MSASAQQSDSERSPLLRPQDYAQDEEHAQEEAPPEALSTSVTAVILVLMVGVFISNADGSLVLASYSSILSDFNRLSESGWLITSFGLAACATQTSYGKVSDIYGRKAVILVAYGFFAFGNFLSGIGSNLWQVILGRVLGGVGGAGMSALVSIIISDMVPVRQIAPLRSYVNIAATVGRSLGGPIGGGLADSIGWRWGFLIQVPFTIAAMLLVAWRLPSVKIPVKSADDIKKSRFARLDIAGALTLAATIVVFLLAVDTASRVDDFQKVKVILLSVGAAFLTGIFLLIEAFWAKEPVFPLRLLVHRDVITAYLIVGFQIGAQLALMFSIPLYFQVTQNASASAAGAKLIPAVVGNAVGGILSGVFIHKTGRYKLILSLGTLFSSLGYLTLILRWHGNTPLWELIEIVPGGFGTGVAISVSFIALTAGIKPEEVAIAGSGHYLSAGLGMVVGMSVSSAVLQGALRTDLQRSLHGIPHKQKLIKQVTSDLRFVQNLAEPLKSKVVGSYVWGLTCDHILSLVLAATAFVISLFVREHKL